MVVEVGAYDDDDVVEAVVVNALQVASKTRVTVDIIYLLALRAPKNEGGKNERKENYYRSSNV